MFPAMILASLALLAVPRPLDLWGFDGGPENTLGGQTLNNCERVCILAALAGCDNTNCLCNGAHFSRALASISSCVSICHVPSAHIEEAVSAYCQTWGTLALPSLVTPDIAAEVLAARATNSPPSLTTTVIGPPSLAPTVIGPPSLTPTAIGSPSLAPTLTNTPPTITPTLTNALPTITPTLTNAPPTITPTLTNAPPMITPTLTNAPPTIITRTLTNAPPTVTRTLTNAPPTVTRTLTNTPPSLAPTPTNAPPSLAPTPTNAPPSTPINSPPSLAPTTTDSSPPSSEPLSDNGQQVFSLLSCAPCGKDACTFTNTENLGAQTFDLIVGTPIENCNSGTSPVDQLITGLRAVQDSWSVTATVGLELGDLRIQATTGWTRTMGIVASDGLTIHIEPGQQGALVAKVLFSRIKGNMAVGSNIELANIISNQPQRVMSFSLEVAPCGSPFIANTSFPPACSSAMERPRFLLAKISIVVLLSLLTPNLIL